MKAEKAILFFGKMRNLAKDFPEVREYCGMAIDALRDKTDAPDETLPNYAELARAYMNTCGKRCTGDSARGVPPCPFYYEPDFDEFGLPIPAGCLILPYCCP